LYGVDARGGGASADAMDWDMSERSRDARLWLLVNVDPSWISSHFFPIQEAIGSPSPPPTAVHEPSPGIDAAGGNPFILARFAIRVCFVTAEFAAGDVVVVGISNDLEVNAEGGESLDFRL